jgi:hypothetical protein
MFCIPVIVNFGKEKSKIIRQVMMVGIYQEVPGRWQREQ